MDVFVLAEESQRRDTLAAALRASGFEVGTAAEPDRSGDTDLLVVVGGDGGALARAVDMQTPAVSIPDTWSTDRQVRLATDVAGAVLGRGADSMAPGAVVVGDLVIEEDANAAYRAGVPIDLTHREFLLLTLLARHPNRVLNRDSLMEQLWGPEVVTPNTIEVHISSLRRKIEAYGPRLIFTVRRVGYVLRPDGGAAARPAAITPQRAARSPLDRVPVAAGRGGIDGRDERMIILDDEQRIDPLSSGRSPLSTRAPVGL